MNGEETALSRCGDGFDTWANRLNDRWWRLCNLYAIEDRRGRLVKFTPNWAQTRFYKRIWWMNYVLKARQLGFSTFICIFILDRLLFEPNKTAGIIDHTLDDAKKKLSKIRLAYDNLDNAALHPETWEIGALIKSRIRFETESKQELAWSNKSAIYCGTSLRGGTVQYLHISELGKTSAKYPDKAREIIDGALNAIHESGIGFIETTHEGGRTGEAYRICKQSMEATAQAENAGVEMTRLDFRFHFFPWWQEPENVLHESVSESAESRKYFAGLAEAGIALTTQQRAWYVKKTEQQKLAMFKEHPSTPEEAFQAIITGSIYGKQIAALRAQGRICDFAHNPSRPVFTFWDIGMSDFTAIWLVQFDGRDILWRAWHEDNGRPAGHYADVCRAWEARYQTKIAGHYLPHDANTRDRGTGRTYVQYLKEAGLGNIIVVPRTPDLWVGINHTRDILPRSWFHLTDCGTPRDAAGVEYPSGISCLEAYHTRDVQGGAVIQEMPVHDESSHSASAARTLGEAVARGLVNTSGASSGLRGKVSVISGFRGGERRDFETEQKMVRVRR